MIKGLQYILCTGYFLARLRSNVIASNLVLGCASPSTLLLTGLVRSLLLFADLIFLHQKENKGHLQLLSDSALRDFERVFGIDDYWGWAVHRATSALCWAKNSRSIRFHTSTSDALNAGVPCTSEGRIHSIIDVVLTSQVAFYHVVGERSTS